MTKSATVATTAKSRVTNGPAKPATARSVRKPKPAKSSKSAVEVPTCAPTADPNAGRPPSKLDKFATLLLRDEGATLDQMMAATGWLPHTTRSALTGLKKKGYAISSDKVDGLRTYRAVAPR